MKKAVAIMSSAMLLMASVGATQAFATSPDDYGTVTITVLDAETNELFKEDSNNFSIIGAVKNMGAGAGGAIYLGGWNTAQRNPMTFTDVVCDYNYSIQYIGCDYNGYSYYIDKDRSDETIFNFDESLEQNITIYMAKHYFADPVTYSFDELLSMDEKSFKEYCMYNELEYFSPEDVSYDLNSGTIVSVRMKPGSYLKEGVEDILVSDSSSWLNTSNLIDYDMDKMAADLALPEEYYDVEVNPRGFMVLFDGKYRKLADVLVSVKDEYVGSKEFIRLEQLKRIIPQSCENYHSLHYEYCGGAVVRPSVRGDVNGDGKFSVADAVSLQKWLLGSETQLADWEAGDLDGNGKLDVFDLCIMKSELVSLITI